MPSVYSLSYHLKPDKQISWFHQRYISVLRQRKGKRSRSSVQARKVRVIKKEDTKCSSVQVMMNLSVNK